MKRLDTMKSRSFSAICTQVRPIILFLAAHSLFQCAEETNPLDFFLEQGYTFEVREGTRKGVVVGTIRPKVPLKRPKYVLSGEGSEDFSIESSGRISVRAESIPEFDSRPDYILTVAVLEEVQGFASSAPVTIMVVADSRISHLSDYLDINTWEELQSIRTGFRNNARSLNLADSLSARYILRDDIEIPDGASFTPIGDASHPFEGILEGNGFSITGVVIDSSGMSAANSMREHLGISRRAVYLGLFGYLGANASIHNIKLLTIQSISIDDSDTSTIFCIGGMAGYSEGAIRYCQIEYAGPIIGTDSDDIIGGVSGLLNGGKIIDCYTSATSGQINSLQWIQGGAGIDYLGGLVGLAEGDFLITRNASIVNFNGDMDADSIGGLVGWISAENTASASLNNCYASGVIDGSEDGARDELGGFVGTIYAVGKKDTIEIANSYCAISIGSEVDSDDTGGFVGAAVLSLEDTLISSGTEIRASEPTVILEVVRCFWLRGAPSGLSAGTANVRGIAGSPVTANALTLNFTRWTRVIWRDEGNRLFLQTLQVSSALQVEIYSMISF